MKRFKSSFFSVVLLTVAAGTLTLLSVLVCSVRAEGEAKEGAAPDVLFQVVPEHEALSVNG